MSSKKSKSRGDDMTELEYRNEVVMPDLYKSITDNFDKRQKEMDELKKIGLRGENHTQLVKEYDNMIVSINPDVKSYKELYKKLIDIVRKTLSKAMDDGVAPTDHKKLKSIVDKVIKDDLAKIPKPVTKTSTFDKKAKGQELLKRLDVVVKTEKRLKRENKDDEDYDEDDYWGSDDVKEVKEGIKEGMVMDDDEAKLYLKSTEDDIKIHEDRWDIVYIPPVVKSTIDKASKAREAKALKDEERQAKQDALKKKEQAKTDLLKQDMQRSVIKKKAEKELAMIEQEKELAKKFGQDWQEKFNKISEKLIEADNQTYEIRSMYDDKLKKKDIQIKNLSKELDNKTEDIKDIKQQVDKYDELIDELKIPEVLNNKTKAEAVKAIKDKKYQLFDSIVTGKEYTYIDPNDKEALSRETKRIKRENLTKYNREYKQNKAVEKKKETLKEKINSLINDNFKFPANPDFKRWDHIESYLKKQPLSFIFRVKPRKDPVLVSATDSLKQSMGVLRDYRKLSLDYDPALKATIDDEYYIITTLELIEETKNKYYPLILNLGIYVFEDGILISGYETMNERLNTLSDKYNNVWFDKPRLKGWDYGYISKIIDSIHNGKVKLTGVSNYFDTF